MKPRNIVHKHQFQLKHKCVSVDNLFLLVQHFCCPGTFGLVRVMNFDDPSVSGLCLMQQTAADVLVKIIAIQSVEIGRVVREELLENIFERSTCGFSKCLWYGWIVLAYLLPVLMACSGDSSAVGFKTFNK